MLRNLHERVGRGGKIFTVHKNEKFPKISSLFPLRYGPKQLDESGAWQAVRFISPFYILRSSRVEDMPLASSSDPGPPNLLRLLQKKNNNNKASQLLPNLNYAMHLKGLTHIYMYIYKASTAMSVVILIFN